MNCFFELLTLGVALRVQVRGVEGGGYLALVSSDELVAGISICAGKTPQAALDKAALEYRVVLEAARP